MNPISYRRAFKDVKDGFMRRELWLHLGWQDIKQRYRRSVLGPFWITIAAAISSLTMGLLYSMLWHRNLSDFLPQIVIGFVIWNVIQGCLMDGSEVFIENEGLIKQLPAPLTVHVLRLVWRQFLFLFHNVIIIVIILAIYPKNWSWADLSFIPGLILLALNAYWIVAVVGTMATRFRDIAPLMTSLTQLLFFVTPILWEPSSLNSGVGANENWRKIIVQLNPFYHFLEIIRAPLTAQPQYLYHWVIVIGVTIVGWMLALTVLRKYRNRVPYWV